MIIPETNHKTYTKLLAELASVAEDFLPGEEEEDEELVELLYELSISSIALV